MMPTIDTESATKATARPDEPRARAPASEMPDQGHFDTLEADFFRAGEDSGMDAPAGDDDSAHQRRQLLSRGSLMGLTIGSTCLAVLACTALWRSNGPVGAGSPSPVLPAAAPVPARVAPPSAPAPAVAAAAPALPAPAADADQPPAEPATAEALAAAPAAAVPAPASDATAPSSEARERCRRSIRGRRNRDILASCPAALAENGGDADLAIALAKVELDRGHFAQAHAWSMKALAIDPASAEAYVFIGGAEQNRGHGKSAKEAYLHYLRLAPSGRYAAELRTILGSL